MKLNFGINLLFIRPGINGGTETYARDIISSFVKVAADSYDFTVYAASENVVNWFDDLAGITFKHVKRILHDPSLRILYEQFIFPRVLKQDEIDVLFSPGYVCPPGGDYVSIITVHDMFAYVCPEYISAARRIYWRLMIPRSLRRADMVLAVSETTAKDIARFFPEASSKTAVIHESVSEELVKTLRTTGSRSTNQINGGREFILAVSTIKPIKNMANLLKAFAEIKYAYKRDLDLVLVGRDALGTLSKLAMDLCVGENVRLTGYVSDEDLFHYYSSAAVFVLPSYYEGFGLPVVEAMCCGCPVVCSNTPALKEVAGDAAVYFDPNDVDEMAEAILTGNEMRESLITRGYQNLKRFSWEESARKLYSLVQQLLVERT